MYYEPKGTMEKPRAEELYGAKLPPIPKPYHRKPQTVTKKPKKTLKKKINYSKSTAAYPQTLRAPNGNLTRTRAFVCANGREK